MFQERFTVKIVTTIAPKATTKTTISTAPSPTGAFVESVVKDTETKQTETQPTPSVPTFQQYDNKMPVEQFKEYLTRNLDYRSKQIINVFETCDSVTELF